MDSANDGTHFLDYWTVLVRRRWVIYLSVTALLLLASILTFTATPQYKATTIIQIERQNPEILTFRDLGQVDYTWVAYSDFYETQYKVLSSAAVARLAVRRLGLTEHPQFAVDESASRSGWISRLLSWIPRRKTGVKLSPEEIVSEQVRSSLEVFPVPNSHLVHVSWIGPDPELAAQISNAFADAYVRYNIESQYSTSDQAEEFLVNQIATLKRDIGAIEEDLLRYGEAKSIISIDETNNITLRALEDIAQKRTVAQATLVEAQAHYRSVLESSPDALPEILQSNLIDRLRQEYAGYEAEFTEKSRQFKDDWPGLRTLESKLEQARTRLEDETARIAGQVKAAARKDYEEARDEVLHYDELLASQEKNAQRLKRDAVEYANLQSEVTKKREMLNALIGRQNEMALSARLKDVDSSTNIRIMERARPPAAPFRPRVAYNLVVGLFLGCLLGVGMAFFLNYLDNSINSVEDLERIVGFPVLAVVPSFGSGGASFGAPLARARRRPAPTGPVSFDLVTHEAGNVPASEAYRELRTAILLSNPGQPPGRIMITSASPEEGKTATATNLAIVLAQLGKRVLLIDTDLRRPRLHKVFHVEIGGGVSTLLAGQEENPASVVIPTGIDGLDLLPSGPIPPNPSELLNSPVFAKLGTELLRQGYDHVVFDSPPVLSVSDPVIIASVVDLNILVVRASQTARQSVKHAVEKFGRSNVRHFGAVLNDLDPATLGALYHYDYRRYAGTADSTTRRQRKRAAGDGTSA